MRRLSIFWPKNRPSYNVGAFSLFKKSQKVPLVSAAMRAVNHLLQRLAKVIVDFPTPLQLEVEGRAVIIAVQRSVCLWQK